MKTLDEVLNEVSSLVSTVSRLQFEKIARLVMISKQHRVGYMQDEISLLSEVLKHSNIVEDIDVAALKQTGEIIELLNSSEIKDTWEDELKEARSFTNMLTNRSIPVDVMTQVEQRELTKEIMKKEYTIEDLLEMLR